MARYLPHPRCWLGGDFGFALFLHGLGGGGELADFFVCSELTWVILEPITDVIEA